MERTERVDLQLKRGQIYNYMVNEKEMLGVIISPNKILVNTPPRVNIAPLTNGARYGVKLFSSRLNQVRSISIDMITTIDVELLSGYTGEKISDSKLEEVDLAISLLFSNTRANMLNIIPHYYEQDISRSMLGLSKYMEKNYTLLDVEPIHKTIRPQSVMPQTFSYAMPTTMDRYNNTTAGFQQNTIYRKNTAK